jgi:DHA3 family macrolide efflux protein-like MFS transporter
MRNIMQNRALRLIFTANLISMIGSGLNSAGVTWYILQATHSEMALGAMLMLQTIPALLLLPFSGVIIDREDRRRLVMVLDAARGLVVLTIAVLALNGLAKLWEVYLMSILVAAGFWMFWPTMNALIQELTPDSALASSNSFILAGFQGGWLIAGALVGFVYNHIGLGGVLLIDFFTYVLSFTCYLFVRRGRHVVAPLIAAVHAGPVRQFFHELREGIAFLRHRPRTILLGVSWALFIGGMLTQGIITAPFSDRILHAGAVGYGWLNFGWAMGACICALLTPALLRSSGHRKAIGLAMGLLGCCLIALPFVGDHLRHRVTLPFTQTHSAASLATGSTLATGSSLATGFSVTTGLLAAILIYFVMGCCRALGGVAITTGMMESVPRHFMGRVQNTFYFAGTVLQLFSSFVVGTVAHTRSLAGGFAIVGCIYLVAFVTGTWPATDKEPVPEPKDPVAA